MYWDSVVQVSGSDFTTSSTTLVDITGLTFAALANSTYEVEVNLVFQSTSSAGSKFAVAFSAAAATGSFLAALGTTSSVAAIAGNALGTAEATAGGTTASTTMTCWMKVIVVTGANAGNITAQALKVTSGTTTVYIGSVMRVKKLA